MIIVKNGAYPLIKPIVGDSSSTTVVYVSGAFSGATASLVQFNTDKEAIPLVDGAVISGEQYIVDHGFGVLVYVRVENATAGTRINVEAGGLD